jgi:ADP-heptose:LPS heptosyltransferase
MEKPKSILLIRFKSIGDVVLTLPAVHVVRENFPDAQITFFTISDNAPLLQGFRNVDEVMTFDREALRSGNPLRVVPEFFGLLRRLRAGNFSVVVDFQGYGETAWLARLTGAAERWGTIYGSGRRWAYTRHLPRNPLAHATDEHLALLRHGGLSAGKIRNEFQLPPGALQTARTFFAEHKLEISKPTLFIQPFTSMAHKNWPLENYLSVARYWQSRGVQIILGGGPSDRAALEPARQKGFSISAGVPLLVTGGLMQLSQLVLGGDTGALHLAVAQGKRVLMLMHEARPGSPVPFQHRDWVIAAPAPEAIAKISIAEVNAVVAQVFSGPAGNVSC